MPLSCYILGKVESSVKHNTQSAYLIWCRLMFVVSKLLRLTKVPRLEVSLLRCDDEAVGIYVQWFAAETQYSTWDERHWGIHIRAPSAIFILLIVTLWIHQTPDQDAGEEWNIYIYVDAYVWREGKTKARLAR